VHDAGGLKPPSQALEVRAGEGDMVDGAGRSGSARTLAQHQMHHRPAVEIEPSTRKGEGRPRAQLEAEQVAIEPDCALKVGGDDVDVIEGCRSHLPLSLAGKRRYRRCSTRCPSAMA
jgi:hypothetical protein